MMWLIVLGFVSGIISGMGIGGGTVLIPGLVILYGLQQQAAQNINLIYFIPTAIAALVLHIKQGNIEKPVLWRLILFGIVGAVIGSYIAVNIDPSLLRKGFGVFLLIMGVMELKSASRNRAKNGDNNIH